MITPEIQDQVLSRVIEATAEEGNIDIDYSAFAASLNISSHYLSAILEQFVNQGYIHIFDWGDGGNVQVKAPAHSFLLKGGHVAEFKVLEYEMDKLKLEIIHLEKQFGKDKINQLSQVVNSLSSFISTYYRP